MIKIKIDLSIIIPIYNVEQFLRDCLETVYNIKINKEVILINDGSTDNSYFIIKEFEERYSDQTIVINQKNQGLAETRNIGLKYAKGEYITFIDSDDFIGATRFIVKSYNILRLV